MCKFSKNNNILKGHKLHNGNAVFTRSSQDTQNVPSSHKREGLNERDRILIRHIFVVSNSLR